MGDHFFDHLAENPLIDPYNLHSFDGYQKKFGSIGHLVIELSSIEKEPVDVFAPNGRRQKYLFKFFFKILWC